MKQKDIAIIAFIVFFSAILSFVGSRALFGGAKAKQSYEVVEPITANFPPPDQRYFNANAFNPTKKITIGDSNSTDPFKSQKP